MMLVETDFLIVRHDPAIGGLIREILIRNRSLIIPATGKIRQWQDGSRVCRAIAPNWPDPPDEDGATGRFRYAVERMIREIETTGASVETRQKVA